MVAKRSLGGGELDRVMAAATEFRVGILGPPPE